MINKVSAGLILTDGVRFLVCHSTGNNFFDIPKGTVNKTESPLNACIRETMEETSFDASRFELKDLGVFSYNHEKNLHLFLLVLETLPPIEKYICTSFFLNTKTGEYLPEADYFKYIEFSKKKNFLTENLRRVIEQVEEKFL